MFTKTIVVTGANGLLGQKLVLKLSRREAVQLIATGTGPNRNPMVEGYAYEEMDVTDPVSMRKVFETYKPTEIIHTAAMTNVDQCEKEQEKCWLLNVTALQYIVDLCHEFKTRLIHISTDFIFDGLAGPYSEKAQPNPLSHYGRSKLAAEEIIIASGVPCAIARTMLVYGVIADGSRSNFVLWAKGELEKGKDINVVEDQWRCPTLAEDLAEGVVLMTMKDKNGIYNISGANMYSIFELVQMVAEYWKLDPALIHPVTSDTLKQPAKRPAKTGFVIIKAQTELGFKPRTFKESLQLIEKQLAENA
jgi:dTDP-4-dehydrorhamnose reductase